MAHRDGNGEAGHGALGGKEGEGRAVPSGGRRPPGERGGSAGRQTTVGVVAIGVIVGRTYGSPDLQTGLKIMTSFRVVVQRIVQCSLVKVYPGYVSGVVRFFGKR